MAQATHYQDMHGESGQQPPKQLAKIPGYTYLVAAIAALGGLLFGWDTGVISGAELFLKKAFHMSAGSEELAVAAVLFGCIVGAAFGGRLADAVGRKVSLMILAVIFACGAILTAISWTYWAFFGFRVLVGVAIGAASLVTPMFIAEMSPPSIRGALVFLDQLAITVGIAVAYWVDLGFANPSFGWRWMFAIAFCPAAILFIGMLFLKDTPRWYGSKGRWDEADGQLQRFIHDEQRRKEELSGIRQSLEEEKRASMRELFRPGLRWALIVGVGLAVLQQFVGVNTIIYYAPTIFGYAGFKSATVAILATGIVGVVNVAATIVAILLVDHIGRKLLLYIGTIGMMIGLGVLGIVFYIGPSSAGVLTLVFMLVFIVSFAISMGPVFWLMSAELFPNRLRGHGASLSTIGNWAADLLVSITFLTFVSFAGQSITFWTYGFLALITLFLTIFLVPETKGKTLEQIEAYWKHGRQWEPEEAIAGSNDPVTS
jgi:SP family galactose:H+ symporter-like MFS transporter